MMQGLFAVLSYRYNISCAPKGTNSLYISLNSQRKMLSCNINHIIRYEEVFKLGACKFEKQLFNIHFLNWDILFHS